MHGGPLCHAAREGQRRIGVLGRIRDAGEPPHRCWTSPTAGPRNRLASFANDSGSPVAVNTRVRLAIRVRVTRSSSSQDAHHILGGLLRARHERHLVADGELHYPRQQRVVGTTEDDGVDPASRNGSR